MPDFSFTDPYKERNTTAWGHPGYKRELVAEVPEVLLDLNFLHGRYLATERNLGPIADALRAATPAQVEAVRHLMIHALERLQNAVTSRRFSLPDALYGQFTKKPLPADPVGLVVDLAKAIEGQVMPALEHVFERPRNAAGARRMVELVRIAREGSAVCRRMAANTGRREFLAAAEGLDEVTRMTGHRLATLRNGLAAMGPDYADTARAIPDDASVQADVDESSRAAGSRRRFTDMELKRLIEDIGGAREGNISRWGFNRRVPGHDYKEGYNDAEPAPLTAVQAVDVAMRMADVLEAYQDLCHRPEFGGCLTQALCCLDAEWSPSFDTLAVAGGLRDILNAVDRVPSPGRRIALAPVEASVDGRKPSILVGTCDGEDLPAVVLYRADPLRTGLGPKVRQGSYAGFVGGADLAEAAANGFALSEDAEGNRLCGGVPIIGTNFLGVADMDEWLRGTPYDHVAPGTGIVPPSYRTEPFVVPTPAPTP